MKHSSIAVLIGAGIALAAGSTLAQQKPEDIIKYRQSALFIMGQHFGPLAGMAQNKIPYDKDAAMRHAAMVEFMSKLPWDRFAPGTDQGNTKAKPEIWLDLEDFKAKAEKMQGEVAKLAQVSKAGDFKYKVASVNKVLAFALSRGLLTTP